MCLSHIPPEKDRCQFQGLMKKLPHFLSQEGESAFQPVLFPKGKNHPPPNKDTLRCSKFRSLRSMTFCFSTALYSWFSDFLKLAFPRSKKHGRFPSIRMNPPTTSLSNLNFCQVIGEKRFPIEMWINMKWIRWDPLWSHEKIDKTSFLTIQWAYYMWSMATVEHVFVEVDSTKSPWGIVISISCIKKNHK